MGGSQWSVGFCGPGAMGRGKILFFTYLQYPAARLQTGIIHTGLVHAQRDAVQQDDQNGDALKPRARVQSRVKQLRITHKNSRKTIWLTDFAC